jgi:hypothetical protein
VRTLLLLGCLLACTPALAARLYDSDPTSPGAFNLSPSILEVKVNEFIAHIPELAKEAKPQDCSNVGTMLVCNKTIDGFTIYATGHETPPSIDHAFVTFWSNDQPTIQLGTIIALSIFDPAYIGDDANKAQPVFDALSRVSAVWIHLNGVNAEYTIELIDNKPNLLIEPKK